ncbi:cyclase dehydrase [Paracraurococcus lichenis]|uniref:Cyclase dehydrase n=1 Tax=Paracraurococcus lichenis TaxID=3064888 RepID=A0ABT9E471_9PROT|nr:cyclase dehydrase [Paracraurococcus sp. LOR1-02]MDO9710958.1 cyclase dehydrase [Paracraurococcus sp. LOR1-02]
MSARKDGTLATARALGWFSIGLGLAEVLAPQALARGLGMRGHERLIASYGAREIATGIGILSARDPTPWIWGRVAGDALDIGTLATALDGHNRARGAAGAALAAVAGVTLLDLLCGRALSARRQARRIARRRDYGDRSGLPKPPGDMRGAARDFEVPRDFRTPEALRPWTSAA